MQGDQKNKEMVLGDKEEYGAIDFFRLICAILVIAIHIPPFLSFNIKFSFGFSQVICRVAVPFFFLTSGYFVQKKIGDSEQILKYMERLLKMYIIYTVLYLPQIVYRYIESETSFSHAVLSFIRNFLLIGSYTHLWYFVGLLIAVFLLEILVCKLRFEDKKLFWVAIIVYMLGVLGNAYKNIFLNIPILDLVFKVYYKIFVTTRNGVFLGFPFVSLGYLIKKNAHKIKNIGYKKYTLLFWSLMSIEVYMIERYIGANGVDMYLFGFPVAIYLFLSICFIEINDERLILAKNIRKISVLLFALHPIINFYLNILEYKVLKVALSSAGQYIGVVLITLMFSYIILKLVKYEYFKWLEWLY